MKKHESALDILENHRADRQRLADRAIDPDGRKFWGAEARNIKASLRVLRADAKRGKK